jgi:hypothetical protein
VAGRQLVEGKGKPGVGFICTGYQTLYKSGES